MGKRAGTPFAVWFVKILVFVSLFFRILVGNYHHFFHSFMRRIVIGRSSYSSAIKINVIEWVQNINDDNEVDYNYISRCSVYVQILNAFWVLSELKESWNLSSTRSNQLNTAKQCFNVQCACPGSWLFIHCSIEYVLILMKFWKICAAAILLMDCNCLWLVFVLKIYVQIHCMQIAKTSHRWLKTKYMYMNHGHHVVKVLTQFIKMFSVEPMMHFEFEKQFQFRELQSH